MFILFFLKINQLSPSNFTQINSKFANKSFHSYPTLTPILTFINTIFTLFIYFLKYF